MNARALRPLIALLMTIACAPPVRAGDPAKLEWTRSSERQQFDVSLAPQAGAMPLNRFHRWVVTVRDRDGRPVHPATLAVDGGMPGHGHGLPTRPQVTEHLGQGRYLIEGMKFNMAGEWLLLIMVQTAAGNDRASFTINIDY